MSSSIDAASPEDVQANKFDSLARYLTRRPDFDLLHAPLTDLEQLPDAQNLDLDLDLDLDLLRAWQRVLRLIPGHDRELTLALVRTGVRSALEIAALSRQEFAARHGALFERFPAPASHPTHPALIDEVHRRARVVRARVHLLYIEAQQRKDPRLPLSLNRALTNRQS